MVQWEKKQGALETNCMHGEVSFITGIYYTRNTASFSTLLKIKPDSTR